MVIIVRSNYTFTNNGFRIIMKPLTGITIGITFITIIPFIGMLISSKYDYLQALSILIMIPAVVLIMAIFFSVFFLSIYFKFQITENQIIISRYFRKRVISIDDLQSIETCLKFKQSNYVKLNYNEAFIKLNLIGSGGRFIYDEFFIVIDELKASISSE
jgi:hypothetical protein